MLLIIELKGKAPDSYLDPVLVLGHDLLEALSCTRLLFASKAQFGIGACHAHRVIYAAELTYTSMIYMSCPNRTKV